jgi:hypothetical protein
MLLWQLSQSYLSSGCKSEGLLIHLPGRSIRVLRRWKQIEHVQTDICFLICRQQRSEPYLGQQCRGSNQHSFVLSYTSPPHNFTRLSPILIYIPTSSLLHRTPRPLQRKRKLHLLLLHLRAELLPSVTLPSREQRHPHDDREMPVRLLDVPIRQCRIRTRMLVWEHA